MDRPANDILPQVLARLTVESFIRDATVIEPPAEPRGMLAKQAGVFVTLRTSDDQLRGCIGTIEPVRSNVAEEIIQNAVSAASRDPRFAPVSKIELPDLTYGVDVLSVPEPAGGPEDLDRRPVRGPTAHRPRTSGQAIQSSKQAQTVDRERRR